MLRVSRIREVNFRYSFNELSHHNKRICRWSATNHRGPIIRNRALVAQRLRNYICLSRYSRSYCKSSKPDLCTREYFDHVARELNIQRPEQWYSITNAQLAKFKGYSVLVKYNHNIPAALAHSYPEHTFLPWLFRKVPRRFWDDANNLKATMTWVGEQLGLKSMDDWYSVDHTMLKRVGLGRMFKQPQLTSIATIVMRAFPEHPWKPWKFGKAKRKWIWSDRANVRAFFDWFKMEMNLSSYDDFYKISTAEVVAKGGGPMLQHFGNSLYKAICFAYPHKHFHYYRFRGVSKTYWKSLFDSNNPTALADYVSDLGNRLNIQPHNLNAWYQVRLQSLNISDQQIISSYGGLRSVLKLVYPQHSWNEARFIPINQRRRAQILWVDCFRRAFPHSKIEEDVKMIYNSRENVSYSKLELDCYAKEINVALEVQGTVHYFDIIKYGACHEQNDKDMMKAVMCAVSDITLIEIPYWQQVCLEKLQQVVSYLRHPTPKLISVPT